MQTQRPYDAHQAPCELPAIRLRALPDAGTLHAAEEERDDGRRGDERPGQPQPRRTRAKTRSSTHPGITP